ncbi:MAG: hypothetical protein L6Q38_12810, partial [Nitrospira sp.]|nr:hypothetical protein [Nitrospira sp.]
MRWRTIGGFGLGWISAALGVSLVAGGSALAAVTWTWPVDGGTPREASRIMALGDTEFSIRAAFEEGGSSVLRHAVSRLDLECRNDGTNPVWITAHLDLSDGGKRTDYDHRPEAGMPWRDFV